ncbi:hypothetical protein [Hahella ganghwensis]|uniref:hypothetical protein n=1 Tax=Hahella ganghwensis TaxID=286420 RepID=UPI000370923B|nr:hypothetical protein [Hahella ganghwensis]
MTVIRFKGKKAESSDLVEFVKRLPTVKNLKVYGPGEAEELSPATRRLLMREKNTTN